MSNQNSGSGGTSPEVQPVIDPASNSNSGQTPPVVALTSTSVPAGVDSQSGAPGPIVPDGAKGGHD
jgi:hypothetical protein